MLSADKGVCHIRGRAEDSAAVLALDVGLSSATRRRGAKRKEDAGKLA